MSTVVKSLIVYQNTQNVFVWAVTDSNGNPVNLTGHSIKFNIFTTNTDDILDSASTVTLSASNQAQPSILDTITVTIPPASVPDAGRFQYNVRDYTANMVYGDGPLIVKWSPE